MGFNKSLIADARSLAAEFDCGVACMIVELIKFWHLRNLDTLSDSVTPYDRKLCYNALRFCLYTGACTFAYNSDSIC